MEAPPLGVSPLEKGQRSALAVFNGPLSSSTTSMTTTTTANGMTTGNYLVSPPLPEGVSAQGPGLASDCTINGATPCITPSNMFQALIGSGGGVGVGVGDIAVVDISTAISSGTSPGAGDDDGSSATWLFNGLSAQGQGLVLVVDQVPSPLTPSSFTLMSPLYTPFVPYSP